MTANADTDDSAWPTGVLLLGVIVLTVVLFAGYTVVGSTGESTLQEDDEPGFVVELDEHGDATLSMTYTFDLDSVEGDAFDDLQDSEEREEFKAVFETRMEDLAASVSEETDREVSVSDAELEMYRVDETGVVTLSVGWTHLAAVSDDDIVVTEPFASGFSPDRPFVVVLPESYEMDSVTHEPDEQSERSLMWDAESDLTGFELVLSPAVDVGEDSTEDATDEGDEDDAAHETEADDIDDDGPGFGVLSGIVGLLGLVLFTRQRDLEYTDGRKS